MSTQDTNVEAITPEQEGAAVRMMLEMGIPAQEVADWTMAARKRRDAAENTSKEAQ